MQYELMTFLEANFSMQWTTGHYYSKHSPHQAYGLEQDQRTTRTCNLVHALSTQQDNREADDDERRADGVEPGTRDGSYAVYVESGGML